MCAKEDDSVNSFLKVEQVFHRNLSELEKVFQFIESDLSRQDVRGRTAFAVKFVVEELFTNMVKYGKRSQGNITLSIERTKDSYIVRMVDDDVEEFDVTRAREVDPSQPLEERTPGGLGIYLVNKIVDSIQYEYVNRQSIITFSKRLE